MVCVQALIGLADGPTVSYLRLHYFSSEGTRAFVDAINMAEYWGVEGYIVDLRNNPGGPSSSFLGCAWSQAVLPQLCVVKYLFALHMGVLTPPRVHPVFGSSCSWSGFDTTGHRFKPQW